MISGSAVVRLFRQGVRGAPTLTNDIAGIAQLVEQLICNQQVIGSSPIAGSRLFAEMAKVNRSVRDRD